MKKILSLICAAAIAMSMMAVTVSAAVTKPTVTTEYVDLSSLDTAKYHYLGVKVTYEFPEAFKAYNEFENEDEDMEYEGYLLSGFQVGINVGTEYAYNSGKSTLPTGLSVSPAFNNGIMTILFAPGTTISNWYCGDAKVDLGTYAFRCSIDSTVEEKTLSAVKGQLTAATKTYSGLNPLPASKTYADADIDFIGATLPAYPAAPVGPTATAERAWDTGLGLLVIAKVEGDYTTKGINLTKDGVDYKLPEASKNAGLGPNFPVNKAASTAGYYGLYIRDAAPGSYVAKAYANENVETTGINITIAD